MLLLQEITPSMVRSAYEGDKGKCCCGCAGKHFYSSALLDEAGKDRGYSIEPDEISDADVLRILRTIQANDGRQICAGLDYYSVDIGRKCFIIFPSEAAKTGAA